jgi:hypothetical protein
MAFSSIGFFDAMKAVFASGPFEGATPQRVDVHFQFIYLLMLVSTMQYPPTGNTHLPVSKKKNSPYKMPNFIYTVLCQKKRYFNERMPVVLVIAWN